MWVISMSTSLKKARYVDEKECTACGDCATVCPVVRPDEFNLGLSSRRAIFTPFPQAVPSSYVINVNECLGHNPVVCAKCIEACDKDCIDFHMSDKEIVEDVGSIVVATGLEVYDPTELDEYAYARFETSLPALNLNVLSMRVGLPKEKSCDLRIADVHGQWDSYSAWVHDRPRRVGATALMSAV